MNFAEAAMLIQGSVCVFGKKVWIRLCAYTEYQVFSLMYGIQEIMTPSDLKRNMLMNLKA